MAAHPTVDLRNINLAECLTVNTTAVWCSCACSIFWASTSDDTKIETAQQIMLNHSKPVVRTQKHTREMSDLSC